MSTLLYKLAPPGVYKKNLGALYRAIDTAIDGMKQDGSAAALDFFPLLARPTAIPAHCDALGVPHFIHDSPDRLKERAAVAGFYLDRQGEYGQIIDALDAIVPQRWHLREYPKLSFRLGFSRLGHASFGAGEKLFIYVDNITDAEYANIDTFLRTSLDPDIDIIIKPTV